MASFDMVVHHGGAGITQSCIIHKVKSIVVPAIADQFIWANIVQSNRYGIMVNYTKTPQ